VLVVIFAPLFYVLIEKFFGRQQKKNITETENVNSSEVK
jgi:hypothetical protein